MHMLAELVELARRVDTHNHTHTAAVVTATTGAVLAQATVAATPAGYRQLLALADQQPGERVWAIEGTGGYGAGLTRFLQAQAERVVELDRPSEPPAATAPSPTRWTRPGPPAKRWAVTSSPSPSGRPACGAPGPADHAPLRRPGHHRHPTPAPRPGGRRPGTRSAAGLGA
jgi:Transposase